jgi:hypothetical protein
MEVQTNRNFDITCVSIATRVPSGVVSEQITLAAQAFVVPLRQ